MKIAALYDLHGNLPALEAVLTDIRAADVDQILIGGDIFPGPMAVEILDRLLDLDIPVQAIRGNGENDALAVLNGKSIERVPLAYRDIVIWSAQRANNSHKQLMESWPSTIFINVERIGRLLFCHATPRDDNEIFTRLTPEDKLLPVFDGLDADVVICGHTHMQFDRIVGKVRIVNAGSLGMPFGRTGADWLLIGEDIELRHTNYDVEAASERLLKTEYPNVQSFVEQSILAPAGEDLMLELYSKAGL